MGNSYVRVFDGPIKFYEFGRLAELMFYSIILQLFNSYSHLELFDRDISNQKVLMEMSPKMRLLDLSISKYVTSKDPTRKSTSKSVFMGKSELQTFYGNMHSKVNQEIQLSQFKIDTNQDRNKLLVKEQQRTRNKIQNRTFYLRNQSANTQTLSNKENIKMNNKPLISDHSFKAFKLIKTKNHSQFLTLANAELLMSEYIDKNQILRERKTKSMSYKIKIFKEKEYSKNTQEENSYDKANRSNAFVQNPFDKGIPHRKAQLIELYQKMYEQFTKQQLKTIQSIAGIQSKFLKGFVPEKPQLSKVRSSTHKFSMTLNNKRMPLKL